MNAKVIFSDEVNNGMINYFETLKSPGKYNVSAKRARGKYLEMKRAVLNPNRSLGILCVVWQSEFA